MDDLDMQRRRRSVWEAAREAALSGATAGGALGGVGSLLAGARNWKGIAAGVAKGAGVYGGVSGGAQALGGLLAGGAPDDDDANGHARHGALGGLVGGGLAGAALGALASKGHVKVPGAPNMLSELIAKASTGRAAAIGGIAGGIGGGYLGGDEGMILDAYRQEQLRRKRERIMEAMQE